MKNRIVAFALIFGSLVFGMACQRSSKETKSEEKTAVKDTTYQHVEYYPQGQLKIKGLIQNGKKEGLWTAYYPSGIKWSESEYQNGNLSGNTTAWFENGFMRYQGRYDNNKRTGVWVFYNKDGSVQKRIDMDVAPSKKH